MNNNDGRAILEETGPGSGLFAVHEQMPCEPDALRIGRYTLLDTLGRSESEEAAARLLSFSTENNAYVGVSWKLLARQMVADLELDRSDDAEARTSLPMSSIYLDGIEGITNAMHALIAEGMMRIERDIPNEADVIFPTAKLIETIAEKQGVLAAA